MKNRRIVVISIMLIAVLCLGVGYAALTDDLFVTGQIEGNKDEANRDFVSDVYFASNPTITKTVAKNGAYEIDGVTATVGADDNSDADDKLTITVPAGILNFGGDTLTIVATINNDSDEFKAVINADDVVVTGADQFATVTCMFGSSKTATIDAEGSAELTITIVLDETITSDVVLSESFTVKLNATSAK